MKKIILGLVVATVSFTILVFYYGLNTEKIYNTEDLIGKTIRCLIMYQIVKPLEVAVESMLCMTIMDCIMLDYPERV